MELINYTKDLVVRNVDQLPKAKMMPYLECVKSHVPGELIAKAWRQVPPANYEVLIRFKSKGN